MKITNFMLISLEHENGFFHLKTRYSPKQPAQPQGLALMQQVYLL